jgi:uncharacterized repeat protein (TIGR03803 family)
LKARIKKSFVVPVLVAALGSLLAGQAKAQSFKVLHDLAPGEGERPTTGLTISSNRLYGATIGISGTSFGTIYAVKTDGTGFTNLHNFDSSTDGYHVAAPLCISGDTLYGTCKSGGLSVNGTVFKVNIDGSGFTVLHSFSPLAGNIDGASPVGLVLSGDDLYGTAREGGINDNGVVFAIDKAGTNFRTLHLFSGGTEGGLPSTILSVSSNTLYGTTENTVFAINTDGTDFKTLYSFSGGSDGAGPTTALVFSGGYLYGATGYGGAVGFGTIFRLNTDGTEFKTLYSFTDAITNKIDLWPIIDGVGATALIVSGNALYSATPSGGHSGSGKVFMLNTDGTGFTPLYDFSPLPSPFHTNIDGAFPIGLTLSGGNLYGTTINGGSYSEGDLGRTIFGFGTVFRIALPPELILTPSGPNLVLSWPTNFTGYTLQSTTNLGSSVWTTNLPTPVVINGQNTVTNPLSGTQQFFRLSQ